MSVPWMLLRLALDTSVHHAEADADRLAVMDARTRAEYRAFLVRIYGVEAPVQRAISLTDGLDADLLYERDKTDRLREDLEALGVPAKQIANVPATTVSIRSVPQALGWLFVLERHTLVAGIIRRHIDRMLGDAAAGAFNYLSAYGDEPGARFRALGEQLVKYTATCAPSSIVAAANEAFRAQRLWYRGRPPEPHLATEALAL